MDPMRQGICVGAGARSRAEDVDSGSCGAPIWLRWGAKQELSSGESFYDAHGSAADRTVPK